MWLELISGQCRANSPCLVCTRQRQDQHDNIFSGTKDHRAVHVALHLPVALERAEVADLHAAGPALLGGRPAADLADNHQLRPCLAVQAQAVKLVEEDVLSAVRLRQQTL